MPFYEYECLSCGKHTEVLQAISEKPLKKCPSCGKSALKKLMSAPVFRLKGSGWYETDFKSDKENKRNLAGADKEEAKPEAKADDAKVDAKVDAKADAKPDAKGEAAKAEKPKAEKSESAKPAPVKTAASKSASKTKAKSRPAKRPARR
jgi:putative FmdB family regulatory protein